MTWLTPIRVIYIVEFPACNVSTLVSLALHQLLARPAMLLFIEPLTQLQVFAPVMLHISMTDLMKNARPVHPPVSLANRFRSV